MKTNSASIAPLLISACLLLMLSFGFRAGFGLFLKPISEQYGWGLDVMSLALAVQNLCWGVCALFAGGLADRFGNLVVLLTGALCYAAGMVGMAYADSEAGMIATAGLLVGAGIAGTSFGIILPALVRAVPPERRGWVLGLGTSVGSFGQFLLVPLMQQLVDWLGWFAALQWLGLSALTMAVLALPLAPYSGTAEANAAEPEQPLPVILGRAFRVPSYTLLVLGFFVCGFHVAFITVHMPGYVVDLGFAPQVGAWSIGLIGLCNVIGAYISGVQSGRRPKPRILSFIYFGRAIAIGLLLLLPVSLPVLLGFSAVMGFLWLATVPPTTGLVAVFFGTRYMAFLYGMVFLSHQVGSFCGVWLGGFLYERFGSYNGLWLTGMLLALVAGGLHWPIREQDASDRLADRVAATP